MKETLAKMFTSKKFLACIAGCVVVIANKGFNFGLDEAAVLQVLGMIGAYIIGQGVADSSKPNA